MKFFKVVMKCLAPSSGSYPLKPHLLGLQTYLRNDAMPCFQTVMKINNPMNHLGAILWLLRATHLAINPGHVWWLSPENTLYWLYLGTERGHVARKESHHHFRIIKT